MIYFIGIHHKPGMRALDSRTFSGKIIDQIIEEVGPGKKTNLCSTESIPDKVCNLSSLWFELHNPTEGDLIVLLGEWVLRNFEIRYGFKYLAISHPASCRFAGGSRLYIKNAVEAIQKCQQQRQHTFKQAELFEQ